MDEERGPFGFSDEDRDDDFDDDFADQDPFSPDGFGCLFPEECCMPDPYHFSSECHTAEMMETLYAGAEMEANAEAEGHGDA